MNNRAKKLAYKGATSVAVLQIGWFHGDISIDNSCADDAMSGLKTDSLFYASNFQIIITFNVFFFF